MNCPECVATRWPGGHPPAARRVYRLRVVTVAPAAFLAVTCLASIGVALAVAFLAFNLHFRKHKQEFFYYQLAFLWLSVPCSRKPIGFIGSLQEAEAESSKIRFESEDDFRFIIII
ncbi:hypothetical protein M0802_015593 [Mischocyttarus mexicanus]|nr:hypothetical protein M0802_015593 [Mischocyttarus mexicanus]